MGFRLGIDGGGTKTECALADETGVVLARATAGPSNLLRVGEEAARAALAEAIAEAFRMAGVKPVKVDAVCAGLAGAGRTEVRERAKRLLRELVPTGEIFVVTDAEIALEAAAGRGAGVVLAAGTGSVAYGRDGQGREARAGGWGPVVSDEGSATDIGRCAVAAVLDARDGRGAETALTPRVLAALGASRVEDLPIALESDPFRRLAALFLVVAETADAGDRVAIEILDRAAETLSELAGTVIRTLGLDTATVRVAYTGGVFRGSAAVAEGVRVRLAKLAPRAQVSELDTPPAVGAIRLAERLLLERALGRR